MLNNLMGKGDSAYSTGFASGRINHNLDTEQQMRQYKREEKETHSAPNVLPYEMGELPTYFASMVDNGMRASRVLEILMETKEYKHKDDLLKLKNNLDKMLMYLLQNVDATLDKFVIGANKDNE